MADLINLGNNYPPPRTQIDPSNPAASVRFSETEGYMLGGQMLPGGMSYTGGALLPGYVPGQPYNFSPYLRQANP